MILIVCRDCRLAIRVLPTVIPNAQPDVGAREVELLIGKHSAFWPNMYPCPRCDRMIEGGYEEQVNAPALGSIELLDLTPQEAFAAFNGFGLPNERGCTIESLTTALRETPVRRVIGSDVDGNAVVEALELWDGSRIYLGASPGGAVAYRMTSPVSYASRVLESK